LKPYLHKATFRSVLDDPMSRDRSLGMARHSYKFLQMAEWLEDHVAAIGLIKLNSALVVRILAKLETGWGA
jgi:hypothetical protein